MKKEGGTTDVVLQDSIKQQLAGMWYCSTWLSAII